MRAVGLSVLLVVATAHANGRNTLTNGIFFQPGDVHSLYLRTTFGLQISHDDGCTFHWVCEDAIGYGGNYDPRLVIAPDGSIFATTFHGLRVSRDGGCSFTTVTPDEYITGLDRASTGDVWIATGSVGASNDVYRSTDNGMTFMSAGLATSTRFFTSLRVAPSDARRIYAASYEIAGAAPDGGAAAPTIHLLRSDDTGMTWTPEPLTGVGSAPEPQLTISAVDPQQADILFLNSTGANNGGDTLYRSEDGGATFAAVFSTTGAIRDVVIIDANRVMLDTAFVGMMGDVGGPMFVSTDGGKSFTQMSSVPQQVDCLGLREDGTAFTCAANWDPDFMALGTSTDHGATWSMLWRFTNMDGPLSCPAGTAEHDTCAATQWAMIETNFVPKGPYCGPDVMMPDAGTPPPKAAAKAGCCDAGAGGATSCLWACAIALWLRRRRK